MTSKSEWCWYIEGGSFYGGYATRMDAIRAAYMNEADPARLYIGTTTDPLDEMARVVDARSVADQLGEHLNVDDCYVRLDPGAQEALREWVREYLSFDAHVVCLDGDKPTAEEWREASNSAPSCTRPDPERDGEGRGQ